jgi:hypothetical protein
LGTLLVFRRSTTALKTSAPMVVPLSQRNQGGGRRPEDIRGARYPVGVIAALNNSAKNNSAASPSPSKKEAKC